MCLYNKLYINKKYLPNKKNNGIVPLCPDQRVKYVPVCCGKCMECRRKKSNEWKVRLTEDLKVNKDATYVTLTIDNENYYKYLDKLDIETETYEAQNQLAAKLIRLFLERHRRKYRKALRHFFITELGQTNTERLHIHGIIFRTPEQTEIILNDLWTFGYPVIGRPGKKHYCNNKTVSYLVKYITKSDPKHKSYTPKLFVSPGIGKNYIYSYNYNKNKFKGVNGVDTKEYYIAENGSKLPLPIYYRNYLYSEEEREQLWINLLNKEERYVMGEKIDISKNEELYYSTLEYYRTINSESGYWTNKNNADEEAYIFLKKQLRKKTKLMKQKLNSIRIIYNEKNKENY